MDDTSKADQIARAVESLIDQMFNSPRPIPASQFDPNNRSISIRHNKDTGTYQWVHPIKGSPHGTMDNEYVQFATYQDAQDDAEVLGYNVVDP